MGDDKIPHSEDEQKHTQNHGLVEIQEFFERKLEEWKDIEITIAVTGHSGVGKSSLINAITGLRVAKTGVTETTNEPAEYTYQKHKKIKLWDLPGLGTPSCPDLETYCKKIDLEKYDTLLILTASRFTETELQLAKKLTSMKKSFLFVRTKIDNDIKNEMFDMQKSEELTLSEIREECRENLRNLTASNKNVFLISNHHKDKWDFPCLRQAILDVLPPPKKESLTFSLTSDTKDAIKRKVEVLRDRIWKVAAASAAVAAVPFPGLSAAIDLTLITKEVNFYKSQLAFPNEDSEEFRRLTPEMKDRISRFCLPSAVQIGNLLASYAASSTAEEYVRFIPLVGTAVAGSFSFASTYFFLDKWLKELEETALKVLDATSIRVVES